MSGISGHGWVSQREVAIPIPQKDESNAIRIVNIRHPILGQLSGLAARTHPGVSAYSGTIAVTSISTFALSSISATTCTAVIVGKCRPMISRYASPISL